MIKITFTIDEDELELALLHKMSPSTSPWTRLYDYVFYATYDIFVDGKKITSSPGAVPVISLASQMRYFLSRIAIGETSRITYMDIGGELLLKRVAADVIQMEDRCPDIPPIRCNYFELRSAAQDFADRGYDSVLKRFPNLLEAEGDVIRHILLSNVDEPNFSLLFHNRRK